MYYAQQLHKLSNSKLSCKPFSWIAIRVKNAFSEIEADKVIVYNNYLLRLII